MGNFGGHALPGSFFFIIGLWWMIQTFIRLYQSKNKGSLPFKSTATYKCKCLCGCLKTWEVEGAVIIFFCVVGFTLEIITAYKDGKFTYLGNGQHATMFFFFGLAGLTAVLIHHSVPLPVGAEYITMIMAFCVEGLLFKFHLHGRDDMDVLLHTLLLYSIYGCIIACLIEITFRHSVLAALTRAFFVCLQGTWFWQVGFILYNPIPNAEPWDHESHDQIMVITMMFSWHMAALLVVMLVTGSLIGCCYRRRSAPIPYDMLKMDTARKPLNGQSHVQLPDDSESDLDLNRPIQTNGGV